MSDEELRIGVFVCHCGSNIGGFIDVPAVTEYAATLPGVEFATDNLYTCAEDGLCSIRDAIKEHDLNRVVVASCTPRTHAPLFQRTCQEAGLNKYLFTFVNIREHCSWVHMKEPEKGTEKAKELVRMGVGRAALLEPQEEVTIDVAPAALVIGGGTAGMSAALSIADQGFETHLVERENELGGYARKLSSLYQDHKDPLEMLNKLIGNIVNHPRIITYLNTNIKAIEGFIGNFDVTLDVNGEGKDVKIGTIVVATGGIPYVPHGLYGYDENENVVSLAEFEEMAKAKNLPKGLSNVAFIQCVGSRGQDKTYCSRICCNVAIKSALNLVENWNNILGLEEAAVVEEAPAAKEVAEEAKDETSDHRSRRGGRRGRRGRGEREAAPAKEAASAIDVTIFNRDIMSYGVENELNFNKARQKRVKFVRYTPENMPKVYREGDQLMIDYWHDTLQMQRKQAVDLVVLSTPIMNQPDANELAQMLKVPLGQEGFFFEAHVKLRPVDFATDGVFLCGTAHGPADITESVYQALGAASRAAIPLERGYVKPEAITAHVDPEMCSGCGTCVEICPYGAPRKNEEGVAEVIVAACKGCGICGATCPENAITMTHYTDEQLLREARGALEEVCE